MDTEQLLMKGISTGLQGRTFEIHENRKITCSGSGGAGVKCATGNPFSEKYRSLPLPCSDLARRPGEIEKLLTNYSNNIIWLTIMYAEMYEKWVLKHVI